MPLGTVCVAGLMVTLVMIPALTVSVTAGEVMPPNAAVTVVLLPAVRPLATPALFMVAMAKFAVAQVALVVRSALLASVYVPCAVKLVVNPLDTVALTGLMAILVNSAALTLRLVLPVTVMPFATLVAVMVVLPTARVVAMPLVLTVAMPVLLDVHVTLPDTLPAVLSEYVPVAVKVTGNPLAMGFLEALTVMTCNLAVATLTLTLAVLRP